MGLDIRLPIGLLFTIIGALLAGLGVLGDEAVYQRSLGINVNLWWGLVMLLFGTVFLRLSRTRNAAMHPNEEITEKRAMEAIENAGGLESADRS